MIEDLEVSTPQNGHPTGSISRDQTQDKTFATVFYRDYQSSSNMFIEDTNVIMQEPQNVNVPDFELGYGDTEHSNESRTGARLKTRRVRFGVEIEESGSHEGRLPLNKFKRFPKPATNHDRATINAYMPSKLITTASKKKTPPTKRS